MSSFDFDLTAPLKAEFSVKDQSDRRHKVQPVQIVAPSRNGDKFQLNESALRSVLGHSSIQNKKIVIVSVAGAFRKGKSFLLNFFLEYLYSLQRAQQSDGGSSTEAPDGLAGGVEWLSDDAHVHGFHWRSGAKRDTQGIWIWGEPIIIQAPSGDSLAVLLMDTQGAFDNQSTYQQCTTIFALSTIVSSLQVYNVVDNIQEDALQNLSLFVEYGCLATKHARHFGKPFQQRFLESLCFCVRDWKSPEEVPFGPVGGQEYLDHVLKTAPNQAPELRSLRQQLHEYFEQLQCVLLPHPGHRVAERNSFRGHVKDIRPIFRDEIRRMVPFLLSPQALQPKRINGKPATCKKIIQYFKEYCQTFESPEMPTPQNILEANARLICYEATADARTVYCRLMDKATDCHTMIPEKQLMVLHIRCGIAAVNTFDRHQKIFAIDGRDNHHERLQEIINEEFERYKKANASKKVPGCVQNMTACGDSVLLGIGLAGAASGAVVAATLTLQTGLVSAGIVAIPISLLTLTAIWIYVFTKPYISRCFRKT